MKRQDYLDGHVTHSQYYRSIYKALGITFLVGRAAKMQTSPLAAWDALAASYVDKARAFQVFRDHGDVWNSAGMVCAYKQCADDVLGVATRDQFTEMIALNGGGHA
jgi:hypothetical protein